MKSESCFQSYVWLGYHNEYTAWPYDGIIGPLLRRRNLLRGPLPVVRVKVLTSLRWRRFRNVVLVILVTLCIINLIIKVVEFYEVEQFPRSPIGQTAQIINHQGAFFVLKSHTI